MLTQVLSMLQGIDLEKPIKFELKLVILVKNGKVYFSLEPLKSG